MTELKTLKDIVTCPDCKAITPCKDTEVIRKEAIKWIKEFSKEEDEVMEKYGRNNPEIFHDFEPTCEVCVVINWIKYFFNITEEDLK